MSTTAQHEPDDFQERVEELLRRSQAALERGADREHHFTYRQVVSDIRRWPYDADLVDRLRGMYDGSVALEREGAPQQPTYRRGLVDVMAAHLSALASDEAGRPVVVRPEEARLVFDNRAGGAAFTDATHYADPDAVIGRALGRRD